MNSSTDIDAIPEKPVVVEVKKRSAYGASLIVGIALIILFLGLFIVQFSRILNLTGNVKHAPAGQRNEFAGINGHSS